MQVSPSSRPPPEPIEFNRPPRSYPHLPNDEIRIAPPPSFDSVPRRFNIVAMITPVLFLAASSLTFLLSPTAAANPNLPWILLGAMVAATVITTSLNYVFEGRTRAQDDQRKIDSYRIVLKEQKGQIIALQEREQKERANRDLSPEDLFDLIGIDPNHPPTDAFLRKLWQRRPNDPDFLHVRVGLGRQASSLKISAPAPAGAPLVTSPSKKTGRSAVNMTLYNESQQIAREYAEIDNVPVTIDLCDVGSLGISGGQVLAGDLLRAILCHLVFHHPPDEMRLAVALQLPAAEAKNWQWLRDLPHTQPLAQDGSAPMVADTPATIETMFNTLLRDLSRRDASLQRQNSEQTTELQGIHVLLVLIGHDHLPDHPVTGLVLRRGVAIRSTAICLVDSSLNIPGECGAVIEMAGLGVNYEIARPAGMRGNCQQADKASIIQCGNLTTKLRRLRLRASAGMGDLPAQAGLLQLLGLNTLLEYDPAHFWQQAGVEALSTPLGVQAGGPLIFDLKTHGPHGLIAGTTGAGKSELLKTFVLGLAMTQSPRDLTFVLVDYKGGGGLGVLAALPHCVGLITNLQGRLAERALQAFDAELKRRQQRFAELRVENIDDYNRKCPSDQYMARLMIIIDEFAQLVANLSNFMDRLISIAQTGRSLGVHLLLATQRPAGVVSPAIAANTNYRICLRVQSIDESRDVIGRPDAALIPSSRPGRAYFQIGQDLSMFQTARITNRFTGELPHGLRWKTTIEIHDAVEQADPSDVLAKDGLELLTISERTRAPKADPSEVPPDATEADVISHLLQIYAQSQLQKPIGPWLDALPEQIGLPEVAVIDAQLRNGVLETVAQCNNQWLWPVLRPDNWLRATIGVVDDLSVETRQPLVLDLHQEPHVLIVGSAGAGKSTLIRTLVTALTLTHDPSHLWVYLVDLGGQSLQSLGLLPHVGRKGVFTPNQPERIRRLIRWLTQEIEERQQLLGEYDADTIWELNQKLTALGKSHRPALVIAIDNFTSFRSMFEIESDTLNLLARNGRKTGIHLILSTDRPVAVPGALLSNIEIRLALRLNDSSDAYAMVNHVAPSQIEAGQFGRGFRAGRPMLEFQIALPATASNDALRTRAFQEYAKIIDQAWQGTRPRVIDPLPKEVHLNKLQEYVTPWRDARGQPIDKATSLNILIGQDDQTEEPLSYNPSRDGTHLLVIGSAGSGKSTLLRTIVRELSRGAQAEIMLIGPRRSLRDLATLKAVETFGHSDRQEQITTMIECLENEYNARKMMYDQGHKDLNIRPLSSKILGKPIVVIIDDWHRLPDSEMTIKLAAIANDGADLEIYFVVACMAEEILRRYNDKLLPLLQAGRSGVVLRLNDYSLSSILGLSLYQRMHPDDYPPGRGMLVTTAGGRLMQIALSESDKQL